MVVLKLVSKRVRRDRKLHLYRMYDKLSFSSVWVVSSIFFSRKRKKALRFDSLIKEEFTLQA
jgi:hypothetical protein